MSITPLRSSPTTTTTDQQMSSSSSLQQQEGSGLALHSMEARQAAQFGDYERMRQLLDSGLATVDSVDSDECSLLHWAAINNRYEVAELLLQRRCNVNAIGGVLSSTPLHWAARHGHARIVSLLIRYGADWTLRDVEGFTPLHVAVQFGCTPVAAYLIAMGQSPDEVDGGTRMTPAIWAAYKVYGVDPLKMLATLGADLQKSDGTYRNTPLHWAVVQGNHTAVQTLISLNVDLMSLNKENETPLDIARRRNDLLAVKLLEMASRERRLVPSSCRQRLREDKVLARNVIFLLPFVCIFVAGSIFSSHLEYLAKVELLSTLAVAVSLLFRYLARDRREYSVRVLLFGVSVASKLFMILGWLCFLHSVVPWHMQIAFFILVTLVPYCFHRVCNADPGYITASHKERCLMIVSMTEDITWKGNFCSTCLIARPPRSKHCQ